MAKTKTIPVQAAALSQEQVAQAKKFAESARTESVDSLRNLLKQGESPNHCTDNGDYAIHIVMGRADAPRIDFLKMFFDESHKFEVNINAQNKRGQTILHLACKLESPEISQYLLGKGADPNIQDTEGNTCLHILANTQNVSARNEELMQQCLSFGGNIEIANNSGYQPNQMSSNVAHQRLFMQQKIDFDEGVIGGDVEVALSWNNMNDLDLHCLCGCGSHISYSSKVCNNCHGFLDVDMNVQPTSNTPVEHIYWAKVPKGQFQIKVVFYRNHSGIPRKTDYLLVVKVHDKLVFEKTGSHEGEKAEHVILTYEFNDKGEFSLIDNNKFSPKRLPNVAPSFPSGSTYGNSMPYGNFTQQMPQQQQQQQQFPYSQMQQPQIQRQISPQQQQQQMPQVQQLQNNLVSNQQQPNQ